jgi:hypothetical protein
MRLGQFTWYAKKRKKKNEMGKHCPEDSEETLWASNGPTMQD